MLLVFFKMKKLVAYYIEICEKSGIVSDYTINYHVLGTEL